MENIVSPTNTKFSSTADQDGIKEQYDRFRKSQSRHHANDTEHFDHFYKIILTGDAGVGKSNFLLRYVKGTYDNVSSTIGVEFAYKVATLKNKTKVKAQIWDTSGSEKYRSITTGHYRFALGAVLVYDIANVDSFSSSFGYLN